MSTHPVEPRSEGRSSATEGRPNRPLLPAVLHETGAASLRRAGLGARSAVINDERGQPVFEQHGIEVPDHLEPDRDEHRGLQVLPRAQLGSARARAEREAAHLPGRGHHPRLGRASRATSRPPDDLQAFSDELTPPARAAEGGLQQPGLVQRGDREAPAGLRVLHQLRQRHHGIDPRPGQDRGHALQVRLGHGLQPLQHPLQQGAPGRRRHRLGPRLLHARLRRLRRRHQERRQDPPRGQDGDPERRPPRHRGVHQQQGGGGAQGLGPHRRRLRRRPST